LKPQDIGVPDRAIAEAGWCEHFRLVLGRAVRIESGSKTSC
jgi:hypothetical protein